MSLKAKVEAIIYAAEEPVTLEQISLLLKDTVLADLAQAKENAAILEANSEAEAAEVAAVEAAERDLPSDIIADTLDTLEPGPLMPKSAEELAEAIEAAEAMASAEEADAAEEEAREELSAEAAAEAAAAEEAAEDDEEDEGLDEGDVTAQESAPSPAGEEQSPAESLQSPTAPQEDRASVEDGTGAEAAPDAAVQPDAAEVGAPEAEGEAAPAESAKVSAPETSSRKRQPKKTEQEIAEDKAVRARVREVLVELITDYAKEDRGMEIKQVAGGFRMATKPEHHDVVRAFAKSLKPPIRLSLAALETLAVIAYKQPVTGPEIAEIRGVESASVLGTLLDRKLITTAGRKQVIGRPMQYKTSKDFLLRFGLNDVNELPSMEEFSQLASDSVEIAPPETQEAQSLFEPETVAGQENEAVADAVAEEAAAHDAAGLTQQAEAAETHQAEAAEAAVEAEEAQVEASSPEPQNDAAGQLSETAGAADSQPQPEAETSNEPEAGHSAGE